MAEGYSYMSVTDILNFSTNTPGMHAQGSPSRESILNISGRWDHLHGRPLGARQPQVSWPGLSGGHRGFLCVFWSSPSPDGQFDQFLMISILHDHQIHLYDHHLQVLINGSMMESTKEGTDQTPKSVPIIWAISHEDGWIILTKFIMDYFDHICTDGFRALTCRCQGLSLAFTTSRWGLWTPTANLLEYSHMSPMRRLRWAV